jgi:hypothetical protein
MTVKGKSFKNQPCLYLISFHWRLIQRLYHYSFFFLFFYSLGPKVSSFPFHILVFLGPQIKDVKRKKKKGIISCVQLSFQTHLVFPYISYHGCVWKVRTQDPENFNEEVKSLVSAWRPFLFSYFYCVIWAPDIRYQSKTCFLLHSG